MVARKSLYLAPSGRTQLQMQPLRISPGLQRHFGCQLAASHFPANYQSTLSPWRCTYSLCSQQSEWILHATQSQNLSYDVIHSFTVHPHAPEAHIFTGRAITQISPQQISRNANEKHRDARYYRRIIGIGRYWL